MVGFYADSPARRLAYHKYGTIYAAYDVGFTTFSGVFSQGSVNALNAEAGGGVDSFGTQGSRGYALVFPTPITLRAYLLSKGGVGNSGNLQLVQVSTNTTNGIDGNWAAVSTQISRQNPGSTGLRTLIQSVTPVTNVISIRWGYTTGSLDTHSETGMHIFGDRQTTSRCAIWHPTLDQEHPAAHFDYGDVPRGTQWDINFRVKNLHALTAHGIIVSREAQTLTSPSQVTQKTISQGAGYAATQNIGDLAPGAISSVLTLRNSVDPAAQLSLAWAQLYATAASFS